MCIGDSGTSVRAHQQTQKLIALELNDAEELRGVVTVWFGFCCFFRACTRAFQWIPARQPARGSVPLSLRGQNNRRSQPNNGRRADAIAIQVSAHISIRIEK